MSLGFAIDRATFPQLPYRGAIRHKEEKVYVVEVAKVFLNLRKLGIPKFSVLFFPFFSVRIFPWWQNRFPSSFSNVLADWEANSG